MGERFKLFGFDMDCYGLGLLAVGCCGFDAKIFAKRGAGFSA